MICDLRSLNHPTSNMQSENSSSLMILLDLSKKFAQLNFDQERALKVEHIYGTWGMLYAFEVGPFLSLVPLFVSILMYIIFKRRGLLGVTQKFIMSNIIMNVCFTSTAAIRDGLLRIFNMNYGFLEYSVCMSMMLSLRVQLYFVSTSMWLTSLMLLHQVLLIGFPLRAKLYNGSSILFAFFIIHLIICSLFFLFLTYPSFESVPLIQEFKPGFPLKRINGCILHDSYFLSDYIEPDTIVILSLGIFLYTKLFPFALNVVSIIALIILLAKHIRTLSLLVHNVTGRQIKYVVLMKVNICLGMSFILQELPVIVLQFYQFKNNDGGAETESIFFEYQGITNIAMSISFCIGKPIDLLIYSSLSKAFQEEMKHLLLCGWKRSREDSTTTAKTSTTQSTTK